MKRELIYAGDDRDLVSLLKEDSQARNWQWTAFAGYEELAPYLRDQKRYRDHPPIVLDIDFKQSRAAEIVRDIKRIDGAFPLIVVSRQPSLTAYSLARMDGAEAFFTKPLDNLDGLIEGIEAAFDKVDRWERTLRQMRDRAKPPVKLNT